MKQILLIVLTISLAGCGSNTASSATEEDLERERTVRKKEREQMEGITR
jgi:hypothetical protein